MKKLMLPIIFLASMCGQANARRQGADVNELGKFIGQTVQISGTLRGILLPGKNRHKTTVLIDDDMLSGISVKVILMRGRLSKAYRRSIDSAKGREVFINAKIKKINGNLVGINYEEHPGLTIIIPLPSDAGDSNVPHPIRIKISDAAMYPGKYVQVCDAVRGYRMTPDSIYLALGKKQPGETLIVAGSRHEIPRPDDLVGKLVVVNGHLVLDQQKPVIKAPIIYL